ncbi:MAG: HEPN domain-containing protein [Phycisphaerae bacterium]|nr:HEPN domain-containing protein [Phycisphaerae bacterium]
MTELRDLIEKAERFLHTAEYVLSIEDYDSCASRGYYAMFFMAEAALLTKELTSSSHKGVINLFGDHFVRTGIFEKHLGNALNLAYRKRIIGDYGVDRSVTKEEAEELLETARDFVGKVKDYLDQWTEQT